MSENIKIPAMMMAMISGIPLFWEPARNFEYEYALLLSWILVTLPPLAGRVFPSRSPSTVNPPTSFEFFLMAAMPFVTWVPGALAFWSGRCPCGGMGFVFWMTLLVVPAAWLGLAGYFYGRRWPRVGFSGWFVVALPWLIVVVNGMTLWFFPQKRLIGLVLGFVHGPVYDRWIPVDWGLVLARLSHGILGLTLMALAVGMMSTRGRSLRVLVLTALICRAVSLGYESSWHGIWALDRALPQVIRVGESPEDGMIELRYQRRSARDEDLARALAWDAAFHVKEIKSVLGVSLKRPVMIYAYAGEDSKKLLFGGGDTDVTDVWTPTVHIELTGSPHPTLRHELVHAVASYTGWHGIGFHPNMMITEGLAMALAPTEQTVDFDGIAASMLASGRVKSVENLLSPLGFWSESGTRAYYVAGSFLRWLFAKYGNAAIRDVYSGRSLELVTGRPVQEILAEWSRDIASRFQGKNEIQIERFTRDPGVLADLCPHTIEDLARGRSEGLLTRLRQPMFWDVSDWSLWRTRLDPGDRGARIQHLRGELRARFTAGQMDAAATAVWIETVAKGYVWPPVVVEDLEMALIQSDLLADAGQADASGAILAKLGEMVAVKNPGGAILRQIEARMALRSALKEPASRSWQRYLAGWSAIPGVVRDDPWIAAYLRSRRELYPTREELTQWVALLPESAAYPEIKREWTRMLAAVSVSLQSWDLAADLYRSLAASSAGESRLLAEEHLRRVEYLRAGK